MPAPNLGLVGAYGAEGVQKAIQQMVAERRAAEQLEYERATAERDWQARQASAQELRAHQKALQEYQAKDLEVRQAGLNQRAKPIVHGGLAGVDPADKGRYTVGIDPDTGERRWQQLEAPPEAPKRSLQSETVLVNGKPQLVGFDPTTAQYLDQSGQVIPNAQPVPKEVDPAIDELRQQRILLNNQLLRQDLPRNVQQRVDEQTKRFESDDTIKAFAKIGQAMTFVESLPLDTNNPQDDQALIYAFAKAMDPDSAVREGEYATVQKYAQSWAQRFGKDVIRVVKRTDFLDDEARADIKATIRAAFEANRQTYGNLRTQYAKQIDQVTGRPGTGGEYLIDYAAGFEGGGGKFQATDPNGKLQTFPSQSAMEIAKKGWADYEARTKKKPGGGR